MQDAVCKFGAFDPWYPNGIVAISGRENIFGLRVLTLDTETGTLAEARSLNHAHLHIGPMDGDRLFSLQWQVNGKKARIRWGRTSPMSVYGDVEADPGLLLGLELYVPWEYRITKNRWVNFTRQAPCVFTGELISPYAMEPVNALRLITDRPPDSAQGYNSRADTLEAFRRDGRFINVAPGNIWEDMGISWLYGMAYAGSVRFMLEMGEAAAFLPLPTDACIQQSIAQGAAALSAAARRHSQTTLRATGPLGNAVEALVNGMHFNTIYREDTARRYIMAERSWARGLDGWGILFNWDTFLGSWTAAWVDEALASENMLSGYDMQLPDGRIPLHVRPRNAHAAEPPITAGRAQHIVQGITLWTTYLHTRDDAWLTACYEGARRAHGWWFRDRGDGQAWRDGAGLGLLGFGYDPALEMGVLGARVQPYAGKAQYAYFETYDDSPQWSSGQFFKSVAASQDLREEDVADESVYRSDTHTADIYTLERCCLYLVDCECLKKAALALGRESEAAAYHAEYAAMAERVNRLMWDEADGCYYNRKFDGTLSSVQSPDCFLPMMAGIATPDRIERLMTLYRDTSKFSGAYMIPSVARDDPAYPDQNYWRGQIWPPMVLWTYLGLRRAGKAEEAWALANNAAGMLATQWREHGYYPETFNADTGEGRGACHYSWGTLLAVPMLEELVHLEPDHVIFGNPHAPTGLALRGVRIDGHLHDIECLAGETRVLRDGELVGQATGTLRMTRQGGTK